jgi:hypothetical protein
MKNIDIINESITSMNEEAAKLEKGVKASAARLRKILQVIRQACKEGRAEAIAIKNGVSAEPEPAPEPENNTEDSGE